MADKKALSVIAVGIILFILGVYFLSAFSNSLPGIIDQQMKEGNLTLNIGSLAASPLGVLSSMFMLFGFFTVVAGLIMLRKDKPTAYDQIQAGSSVESQGETVVGYIDCA